MLSRDERDEFGAVVGKAVEAVFARSGRVWELRAGGRVIATIVTWWNGSRYDHRKRSHKFLPRACFDWVAQHLRLSADRFAIDTPAKARALFRSR